MSDPLRRDGAGAGDAYTISFDMPTNRGHFAPEANASLGLQFDDQRGLGHVGSWSSAGGIEYVGSLFRFSHDLGANYSGAWANDSTFVVTVINGTGTGAPPLLGRTTVSLANTSELRNRAVTSAASAGIGVELSGDFGSSQPVLAGFEVRCAALAYGAGDVFVVAFDRDTDRGGVRGGRQYVDSLFEFTQATNP